MLRSRLSEQCPSREHFRQRNPFVPSKRDFCPVNGLPTELLSRIFHLGIKDGSRGDVQDHVYLSDVVKQIGQSSSDAHLPHSFQIVVSHVRQHWRNAAISTASLWTTITISPMSQPPYQHVVALLECNKHLPIDIRVRLGSQQLGVHPTSESIPCMADLESLYSLLIAHIHRWRSIEVRAMSVQQMYAFLCAVSNPLIAGAPLLTSLALSTDQSTRDRDVASLPLIAARSLTLFGGSVPCLESVSLKRAFVNWNQDWISHASHLTTLELLGHSEDVCPSWDEFTTILRGAPALECLVLHQSAPRGDPPNLDVDPGSEVEAMQRIPPIQLLNLVHLSLLLQSRYCVYGLLRTLYTPALKSMTIDFLWDDYTEFLSYITAPATVPATLSTEERPRSLLRNLETLDINCLLCPIEVIEVLYDELENVKSLKISMDDSWYASSGCTLILPLFPPEAAQGCVNPRLPQLQTLAISDVSSNLHLQVIHQMAQQRNEAGCPLGSLYLRGTCDVDEEDMTWFKENVQTFVYFRQHAKR